MCLHIHAYCDKYQSETGRLIFSFHFSINKFGGLILKLFQKDIIYHETHTWNQFFSKLSIYEVSLNTATFCLGEQEI